MTNLMLTKDVGVNPELFVRVDHVKSVTLGHDYVLVTYNPTATEVLKLEVKDLTDLGRRFLLPEDNCVGILDY